MKTFEMKNALLYFDKIEDMTKAMHVSKRIAFPKKMRGPEFNESN